MGTAQSYLRLQVGPDEVVASHIQRKIPCRNPRCDCGAHSQLDHLILMYTTRFTNRYPTVSQFDRVTLVYPTSSGLSKMTISGFIELRKNLARFIQQYYRYLYITVRAMGLRTMGQVWGRMDAVILNVPRWMHLGIQLHIRDGNNPRYIPVWHKDKFARVRTSDVDPRLVSEVIDDLRDELGLLRNMGCRVQVDRSNKTTQNMRNSDFFRNMSPGSTRPITNRVVVVSVDPVEFQVRCLDGTIKTRIIAHTKTVRDLIHALGEPSQSKVFIHGEENPLHKDKHLGTIHYGAKLFLVQDKCDDSDDESEYEST